MGEYLLALNFAGAIAFGGYNNFKQSQDNCNAYNDTVDQMNKFANSSAKVLANLATIDEYYYSQSIQLLQQMADTHNEMRNVERAYKIQYTLLQIILLIILLLIAALFIMKRKGLLTLNPLGAS